MLGFRLHPNGFFHSETRNGIKCEIHPFFKDLYNLEEEIRVIDSFNKIESLMKQPLNPKSRRNIVNNLNEEEFNPLTKDQLEYELYECNKFLTAFKAQGVPVLNDEYQFWQNRKMEVLREIENYIQNPKYGVQRNKVDIGEIKKLIYSFKRVTEEQLRTDVKNQER